MQKRQAVLQALVAQRALRTTRAAQRPAAAAAAAAVMAAKALPQVVKAAVAAAVKAVKARLRAVKAPLRAVKARKPPAQAAAAATQVAASARAVPSKRRRRLQRPWQQQSWGPIQAVRKCRRGQKAGRGAARWWFRGWPRRSTPRWLGCTRACTRLITSCILSFICRADRSNCQVSAMLRIVVVHDFHWQGVCSRACESSKQSKHIWTVGRGGWGLHVSSCVPHNHHRAKMRGGCHAEGLWNSASTEGRPVFFSHPQKRSVALGQGACW